MQTFKPITIGNTTYQLHELTFHDAIKISRIPERMNEHRISVFLAAVLRDDQMPWRMTVPERYYILIQYLSTQTDTVISSTVSYESYLLGNNQPFKTIDAFGKSTVRQLTGRDVELLETLCEEIGDWVVGAMALQLSTPEVSDLPALPPVDCSDEDLKNALIARASVLKKMGLRKFNLIHGIYSHIQDEMATLCRLGFDDSGFTVLGGTDDAPARFRPSAALTGIATQLDRYAAAKSQSVGRGHADDV